MKKTSGLKSRGALLKVGDQVMWRGGFGDHVAKPATVVSIEISCVDKCGFPVNELEWWRVQRHGETVVDLDNNHWCYGDQISPMPEGAA